MQPVSRWFLAALFAGFLVLIFAQSWGKIEHDTQLPLMLSPLSFLGSTLHVWSQNLYGGTADVGTGFLFPIGLFFSVTHLLHIPTWCAERVWLAVLLTAGCWGVVRLCEALGIGNRWARVLAGLAYCAAPLVFTWTTISVSLLSVVFLPWILVPLVNGSREGSPRRAAARSGVAVALIGGANAVVVLAVLPLGLFWLATRQRGPPPAGLVRLVDRRRGPGLLLVARGHLHSRQVRLQLPALHGDLDADHEHHLGVRIAPGRLQLGGLFPCRWPARSRGTGPSFPPVW